jgi:ABC-type lipoprotein release transport system permease subunit
MVFGFIFSIIGLYSGYIISVWISIQIVHFILKQDIVHVFTITEIWWEAPMEGSVLSFLKAE